jgi:glycosyltransferase involved in cell wall biosynthesis
MKERHSKLKELTVFFPCYNEEANLPELIKQVMKVVPNLAEKYEILIVNDGSKDSTSAIAHAFESENPNIRVIDQENQGFGGALNTGLQNAKYEWVFYTDADLQFDINELYKFAEIVDDNIDMVIGYRIKRAEGAKRNIFAKGMKFWNHFTLGFPMTVKDIDCAFKLIRRDVIRSVGPLASRGNLVSSEFLLKSFRKGFICVQLGVNHYNRKAGTSNCGGVLDIVKVLRETFLLRRIMFNTGYGRQSLFINPGINIAKR